jgi:hypothetical protein
MYIKKINSDNNLNKEWVIYVILNFQYMFLFSGYTSPSVSPLIIVCAPSLFQIFLISMSKAKMTFKLEQTPNTYWVGHNHNNGQNIFETFAPHTWLYMVLSRLLGHQLLTLCTSPSLTTDGFGLSVMVAIDHQWINARTEVQPGPLVSRYSAPESIFDFFITLIF